MSPSLEKRRKRSILHFIWFIVLFFTIQIQFVHTEMSVEEKVNNAVLLQERVLRLFSYSLSFYSERICQIVLHMIDHNDWKVCSEIEHYCFEIRLSEYNSYLV